MLDDIFSGFSLHERTIKLVCYEFEYQQYETIASHSSNEIAWWIAVAEF